MLPLVMVREAALSAALRFFTDISPRLSGAGPLILRRGEVLAGKGERRRRRGCAGSSDDAVCVCSGCVGAVDNAVGD